MTGSVSLAILMPALANVRGHMPKPRSMVARQSSPDVLPAVAMKP